MDETDFVIRLVKEDYLKEVEGCYYVNNLLAQNEALKLIKNSKRFNKKSTPEMILNHFDELFSALYSEEIELYQLRDIYETAISPILFNLKEFVVEKQKIQDPFEKRKTAKVIKMIFYIVYMFFTTYEDIVCRRTENMVPELKKPRGMPKARTKTLSVKQQESTDWNDIKKEMFGIIFEILSVDINLFWPSGVAEKDLIDLVGGLCYKAFENSEISQARLKPLRDKVGLLLALLVARYHHGMAFFVKACDLMKHHEHVVAPITTSVLLMMTNYNCTTVLSNLLSELVGTMRAEDVPSLNKATATLITDIAEGSAELLMSSISVLQKNLVLESYVVRNATLVAFAEIILKCLTGNELTGENRDIRDELLQHLLNHLRDQNSYVRSKVIQLWTKLASARAIPKDTIMPLLKIVHLCVSNKSAFVVKSAVQFFRVILKENPFAAKLDLREIQNQLALAKSALEAIQLKCVHSRDESWLQLEAPLVLAISKVIQNESEQPSIDEESSEGENSINIDGVLIIIAQLVERNLFAEAYSLLKRSEKEFPKASEIRCNLDKTDKIEYYTAVLRKIFLSSESTGPSELGNLHEELKKQRLVVEYMKESAAFVKLMNDVTEEVGHILKGKSLMEILEAVEYFSVAYQFGLTNAGQTVRSLLSYVKCDQPGIKDAIANVYKTLYLMTSQPTEKLRAIQVANRLIRLVKELTVEQASALEELIQTWMSSEDLSNEFVLALLEKISSSNSDNDTVRYSLTLLNMMVPNNKAILLSNMNLLTKTIFEDRSTDLPTVEQFCLMLCQLKSEKKDNRPIRYHPTHDLLKKPAAILVDNFTRIPIKGFIPFAVAAVRMFFSISLHPERLADEILIECYEKLFSEDNCKEVVLARIFHLQGEIAYRKWQYFDKDVVNALRQSDLASKEPNGNEDDEEDEETYNDQCVDDQLVNSVATLCNEVLLTSNKLDEHLADLIVQVFKGRESYSLATQVAAATALTKLMLVSQRFCENNIQLFVTIMEKSREESVRSVLVLGVGDLIYRWPNVVGPWSSHIYARLKDSDVTVRRNTVNVLCHLITREMIKVKGQMSELSLCLVDSDTQIVAQVRCLFEFLSQKGNTLYNLVPDIISRLCNPDREDLVSVNDFNTAMTFIFGLLGKDRQNENLVEKLCTRIIESTNERQLKDLSLCLSLLSYNERSLKRLGEALPKMGERLERYDVTSAVTNVIGAAAKSTKPSVKEAATEVKAIFDEITIGESGRTENSPDKDVDSDDTDSSEDRDHFVETQKKRPKAPRNSKSPPAAKKTRYATRFKK